MDHQPPLPVRRALLLLILLAAAALRLAALDQAPPGVTHDEADHALDAWGVVQGQRPLYFTTSNGREPLYDYATAVTMAAIGRRALAGRLTAAWFGLLLVAATYAWTRRLFSPRVALLTTAGIALGFWPLMIARHALRTVTLPALFSLGMACYLAALGLRRGRVGGQGVGVAPLLVGGLLLGASFYTYIPARALWLLVLGPPLYWLAARRSAWRPGLAAAAGLLLPALLVAAPLLGYLLRNPAAEQRIGQLSQPLADAAGGSWGPLLANAGGALQILTLQGDSAWRYNVAGRPLLTFPLDLLFYAGLLLALVNALRGLRRPQPAGLGSAIALAWLTIGLLPALITGPFLSTTQAAGAQPVLYLFPALAIDGLGRLWLTRRPRHRPVAAGLLFALALVFGVQTATTYFLRWAPAPEVRLQYETTLVESLAFLAAQDAPAVAVSSATPDALHSQAVAAIVAAPPAADLRWFDARGSLVLPDAATLISLPATAPPDALLAPFLADAAPVATLPLAPGDIDRPVAIVTLDAPRLRARLADELTPLQGVAGESARLTGVLIPGSVVAGGTLALLTLWSVSGPTTQDLVQFVHLTGPDGVPLAQADRLDAPSTAWRAGDAILQLHRLALPADLPAGTYQLRSGLYRCVDALCSVTERLPGSGPAAVGGDAFLLGEITVRGGDR